jgi:hypothetical protein
MHQAVPGPEEIDDTKTSFNADAQSSVSRGRALSDFVSVSAVYCDAVSGRPRLVLPCSIRMAAARRGKIANLADA